ncbi:hypothetical protein [Streptomyces antibioticus]|uniref:hypothetical protein n=1 Tax=Streptomyces antibioticus TaxID=1890 RepID=UPI003D709CBA
MPSKKRYSKTLAAIGAIVAATALTVSLAPAANAATPTDAEITAALKRYGDGTWTQTDVNLIRSIPELAAAVPDVTRPEEVTVTSAVVGDAGQVIPKDAERSDPSQVQETPAETEVDSAALRASAVPSAATAGSKKWRMTHITHTHRSLTGAIIFKYHTYAEFQYDGSKVLKWGERSDDFTDEDLVAGLNIQPKLIVDTKSRTPASSGSSKMKREVELCVAHYGCYATLHPWAQVKVYGTGKTAIGGSGV